MKVSVLMTTYNQEAFIAQAIESILMQEVKFDYEIVIGEDASTDRTPEIVSEFQRKHPEKIRVLLRDPVLAERDRAAGVGGKQNFVGGLRACQGEYVALLDGDDYWTDVHKLQKQVDFLAQRPDCVICFHNALMVYEDGSAPPHNMCPVDQKEISTIEDLLRRNFIPACSMLFKRGLFAELPRWFDESPTGDWLLGLLNSEYGNIGYINEVMAVYRIHRQGYWWQPDYLASLERELEVYKMFKTHFGSKYARVISEVMAEKFLILAGHYADGGDLRKAKSFALRSFSERLAGIRAPSRDLCSTLLRLYVPGLHRTFRDLKKT